MMRPHLEYVFQARSPFRDWKSAKKRNQNPHYSIRNEKTASQSQFLSDNIIKIKISPKIIDQLSKISVYSCRTWKFPQEYTKLFKNRSFIPVDIKSTKKETETPFFLLWVQYSQKCWLFRNIRSFKTYKIEREERRTRVDLIITIIFIGVLLESMF